MKKKSVLKILLLIIRYIAIGFTSAFLYGGIAFNNKADYIYAAVSAVIFVCFALFDHLHIGKGERSTYPLQDQMIDYYIKRKNYITLTLKVVSVEYKENKNSVYITFDIDESTDSEYQLESEKTFVLVYQDRYDELNIESNDILTITTAPQKYYNKHVLPILSLHKDSCEMVSLKNGTNNYIAWIYNNIN